MLKIKAKVCGINITENLKSLLTLPVDMVGFVFIDKSERNCTLSPEEVKMAFNKLGTTCQKVGVFENASIEEVLEKHESFGLDYVQLQGDESIFYCQNLKEHDVKLIKAFQVDSQFCFSNSSAYSFFCDYFLFDAGSELINESDVHFNWKNLSKYKGKTPFLLSGKIGSDDAQQLRDIEMKTMEFVDLNSAFEFEPGHKDLDLLAAFIYKLKRPENFNRDNRFPKVANAR